MQFQLPELPYGFSALEPYIDAQTMQIHHDKHHQTYVDKLNAALSAHPEIADSTIEELLRKSTTLPEDIRTAVRNHGGGHSNHSIFWMLLSPSRLQPSTIVMDALSSAFGSLEDFKAKFTSAALNHFGSGWTWLIQTEDRKIEIATFPNQDSPFMSGAMPILGVDVWEHAYYLKYQNRRAEYLDAFWNIVNWTEVERRLNAS